MRRQYFRGIFPLYAGAGTAPKAGCTADLAALHQAFGDHLVIVYAAEPTLDDIPDSTDAALLEACRDEGIDCYSTRSDFLRAINSGVLPAGFSNTKPGYGHYNADGHRLIAADIWREYQKLYPETR